MQEQLYQEERKQSKSANICFSIRRELKCEKCSKNFCKISARQNVQNQTNAKHSSNSEEIFKSTKNSLEKLNTKKDSSNTTPSKVIPKIPNRKKISK